MRLKAKFSVEMVYMINFMDEKKKRLTPHENICLFIFIDKAIHAASLQNSRITISISLHPSIYPVSSSPILVQFNHIRISLGLIVPFSTFLYGGINSISELKLQIILRDSLTSRIIGKCIVPFNSNNSSIAQSEDMNHESNVLESFNFSQKIEGLPYFFHQCSRFPIFSQKHSKNDGSPNKIEICQIVLTVALGKERDKENIMPAEVVSQEQIRFKRNYQSRSIFSPPLSPDTISSPLSDIGKHSSEFFESDKSIKEKEANNYFTKDRSKIKQKMNFREHYKRISSSNDIKKRNLNININNQNMLNLHLNNHKNFCSYENNNRYQNKNIKYKHDASKNLTKDQIQFVIANWEKYALQSGWSPPQTKTNNMNKKFNVSSPTSQQTNKPKFYGLIVRKLIKISPKGSSIVLSKEYDSDNVRIDDQNNNENSKFSNKNINNNEDTKNDKDNDTESDATLKLKNSKSSPITSLSNSHNRTNLNNKKKKKKKTFTKLLNESNDSENERSKRGQSVGPKRTTQYQLINEFSLDDALPDKIQKCFNSDPPPCFSEINEYDSESEDKSNSPIEIFDNDSDFERTAMSSPGFLAIMSPTVSNGEAFFSQNDSLDYQTSVLIKKEENSDSSPHFKNQNDFSPSSFQAETEIDNVNKNVEKETSSSETNDNTEDKNKINDQNENQKLKNSNEGSFDEITKSSFESLEAMIKVPPIPSPPHLKYSIVHFDDLFDSAPSVIFGKKEIISVQVFRARPNPSEKLNTIYYCMKSKANQKKDKIPPPLNLKSLSEPQMPIQKSPSLEKIFEDGFMDSGLDISGIYNDSSSED